MPVLKLNKFVIRENVFNKPTVPKMVENLEGTALNESLIELKHIYVSWKQADRWENM